MVSVGARPPEGDAVTRPRCRVCGEPFTDDDWEDRHDHPDDGEPVHPGCCPLLTCVYSDQETRWYGLHDGWVTEP